jgi:predicted Fe-Mo cluster-binding NifX family protein
MKVAVTVWEKRVSPVFDASQMLLIAEIENGAIVSKGQIGFDPETPSALIRTLAAMEVTTLICGAVSEQSAIVIETGRIRLIPFIAGEADEVLEVFAKNSDVDARYLMPGCGRPGCRRNKRSREGLIGAREDSAMPRRDGTGPGRKGSEKRGERQGNRKGKRGQGQGRCRTETSKVRQKTRPVQGNPTP